MTHVSKRSVVVKTDVFVTKTRPNKAELRKTPKEKLLDNLRNDCYCRIGVSSIHGVGVIAIKDIPTGVNPFRLSGNSHLDDATFLITKKEFNRLPPETRKLMTNFIAETNGYIVPFR